MFNTAIRIALATPLCLLGSAFLGGVLGFLVFAGNTAASFAGGFIVGALLAPLHRPALSPAQI